MPKTPTFVVWFKQGDRKYMTAPVRETKDQIEAENITRVLNEGLQDKAKAMGFHYAIEVLS